MQHMSQHKPVTLNNSDIVIPKTQVHLVQIQKKVMIADRKDDTQSGLLDLVTSFNTVLTWKQIRELGKVDKAAYDFSEKSPPVTILRFRMVPLFAIAQ